MKKLYMLSTLLTGLLFTGSLISFSQEMIVGGDMENASNWTIVDLAAGDGHTETFGYTSDIPTGGSGGCLSMSGAGNWGNAAVCQSVTLEKGVDYKLSMLIKTIDLVVESTWAEAVITDAIPADDGYITGFPINMALNSWDCADVTEVDGDFAENNCGAKLLNANDDENVIDVLNYPGEGDTTIVVVIKVGGGAAYNILIDNVSLMKQVTAIKNTTLSNINVYPTQLCNELNIEIENNIQEVKIVNMLGQEVNRFSHLNNYRVTLDVTDLKTGMYYLIVTDENQKTGIAKAIKL
ncbi:MAG: T9SS type A sorting domain-containing protein [Bacteroidota bacterium]|nr:MAG: T9SS type A sorting domain-containing protein [Bacteroidota bacterium]